MNTQELIDREAIRDLLSSYVMTGDRAQLDDMGNVFTEDAILTTPFMRLETRQGIAQGLADLSADSREKEALAKLTFLRHNITTSHISFPSPSCAKGRTYFMVITDIGLDHTGTYVDDFVKQNNQWLISRRNTRIDYVAPETLFLAHHYDFLKEQKALRTKKYRQQ